MIIAVCDDKIEFINHMQKLLSGIAPNDLILSFISGFSLLDYTSNPRNMLDVLFLDMRMPNFDGLETASELRESRPDIKVIVITAYPEYARKCYEFYPFYYMEKPVTPAALHDCLERARSQIDDGEFILLQFGSEFKYVPIYGIYSIERIGSHLLFTMKDGLFEVSVIGKSLDFYARILEEKGFFRLHRKTVVNMKYVQAIKELSVVMKNGSTYKLSERRKPQFLEALTLWRKVYA